MYHFSDIKYVLLVLLFLRLRLLVGLIVSVFIFADDRRMHAHSLLLLLNHDWRGVRGVRGVRCVPLKLIDFEENTR
jgi:hypothetical protein